jgi:AAA+ ATPase superfamily predicted ATPase
MMVNPFSVRYVIKEAEAFYGRSAELTDLFTRLSAMQSCSVVGPRRIGKSSLLYHLTQV